MKPLTADQEQLVLENMPLARLTVYRMVNKGIVPRKLTEDAVQEAMIGLMQAARAYDPARGLKFSTLAVKCCQTRIGNTLLRNRVKDIPVTLSLDTPVGEGEDTMCDFMLAEDDTEAAAVDWTADSVRTVLAEAGKGHYAEMFIAYAYGMPMEEIAKGRGVSRQNVCRQIGRARECLRKALAEE